MTPTEPLLSPWPARLALAALLVGIAALHAGVLGLPFGNPDDWFHLDVAAGMVAGEGGAFARAWTGFGASDTLRPVPWVLWAIDFALFGWSPAPYFATNLALHLAGVAAVFSLARSLGAGLAGALAAGAFFGLNLASGEATYYLAARDDATACVLAVGLCAAWPRLRTSRRGRGLAVALLLMALCSKPTAAPLALALPLLDRLQPGARPPRRFWGIWIGVVAAWGALLAWLVGGGGLASGGVQGDLLARPLGLLLTPAWTVGMPDLSRRAELLPLLPVLVGLPLLRGRPALAAAAWLLLFLPVPTLWLASHGGLDFGGRQVLLPSVGLALLVAAAMPAGARWRGALGWLLAGLLIAGLGWRHAASSAHFHHRPDPTVERFAAALAERPTDRPLLIALQRGSQGLSSLLTSGALVRMAGLDEPPAVLLQGSDRLLRARVEPYGYGSLAPAGGVAELEGLDAWVLADDWSERWPRFGPVELRPRVRGELAQAWDFAVGPGGWAGWPVHAGDASRPRWAAQSGWRVTRDRLLPEGQVSRVLASDHRPAVLLSPELAIESEQVCGLELEIDGLPRAPAHGPVGGQLAPGGRFALVTWSEDAGFRGAWIGSLLVPLDREVASVRLDLSPAWLAAGTVRRLAVLPSNVPGQPRVRAIRMYWCGDEAVP